MSGLYDRWKAAKDQFFAADLDTDSLPPDFVVAINQGFGFGPALKSFDAADTVDKRAKRIVVVLKAKDECDAELRTTLRGTKVEEARKALSKLQTRGRREAGVLQSRSDQGRCVDRRGQGVATADRLRPGEPEGRLSRPQ